MIGNTGYLAYGHGDRSLGVEALEAGADSISLSKSRLLSSLRLEMAQAAKLLNRQLAIMKCTIQWGVDKGRAAFGKK